MCKAIDKALVNMVSNYDFLGKVGCDEVDVPKVDKKGTRRPSNRAERRKATAHAKNRRQGLAKYADDEIMANSGKVKDTGYRSYEKGNKAWSRKVRYQKFTEPLPELPVIGEITLYEEWNDWDDDFACHPERFKWHVEDDHIVIDKRVDPDEVTPTLYFDERVGAQLDEAEDAIKKFWLDKVIRLERERAAYQAKIHAINRQLKKLYTEGAEGDYDEVLD